MNGCLKDYKLIRLSTLAKKTDISVHCIRTYVDQGLIQVSDRTTGGLLLFAEPVIGRLQFIKTARDAGVPLAKIVRLLAASDKKNVDRVTTNLTELKQYIQETRCKVMALEQSLLTYGVIDKLYREIK